MWFDFPRVGEMNRLHKEMERLFGSGDSTGTCTHLPCGERVGG